MFKESNQIWLYLIGIIIMFGILIAANTNIVVPFISGNRTIDPISGRFATAPEMIINKELNYFAVMETNFGNITLDLLEKNAPVNVNNFVFLSNNGFYTNTKFHRLVPGFLLQGGDRNTLNDNPDDDGFGRPGYLIDDEINWDSLKLSEEKKALLKALGYSSTENLETPNFQRYVIGMANGGPNTNGSQFFILINDKKDDRVNQLDGKFKPFAMIVDGFSVLEKISQIPVKNPDSQAPRPTEDIIIKKVEIFTR